MKTFGIGELSKRSGIEISTVRDYERAGLLSANISSSARRNKTYDTQCVRRVMFIRRCAELSFTTDEIKAFLTLIDNQQLTCAKVRKLTISHADQTRKKINDLIKIEAALRAMASRCGEGHIPKCAIIDSLLDHP